MNSLLGGKALLNLLIPKDFAPLVNCISPNALKVIDWKQITRDLPGLTSRYLQKTGVDDLKQALSPFLPQQVSFSTQKESASNPLKPASGRTILEIYFMQLYRSEGFFLDLRSDRFRETESGQITWSPNGFWVQWEDSFRSGLVQIYESYYGNNPTQLRAGLMQVGLIREDFSSEKITEVEHMLLSHIGGDARSQTFEVQKFTASFEKLFHFLIQNQISLSSDFFYLGAYLTGLYLHLQKLGGSYDVAQAFQSARQLGSKS